jgi:hypothetical protein
MIGIEPGLYRRASVKLIKGGEKALFMQMHSLCYSTDLPNPAPGNARSTPSMKECFTIITLVRYP